MYAHGHLLYKGRAAARGRGHVSVGGSLQPIRDQVLDRQKGARPGNGGNKKDFGANTRPGSSQLKLLDAQGRPRILDCCLEKSVEVFQSDNLP